jgi:hypothetical protein
MFRRIASFLVLVAAVAAVAGAAAGNARAQTPLFLDFCKTAAPHATLSLGAGVPSVQSTSPSGSYASGLCPRYVVDIHVPTSSSGGPGYFDSFTVGGGYAGPAYGSSLGGLPLSQVYCAGYEGSLRVYRKSALGGDFAYLGGGGLHGEWQPSGGLFGPYCALTKSSSFVDLPTFNPPPLVPVVYRVTVSASLFGYSSRVRAGAWHGVIVS